MTRNKRIESRRKKRHQNQELKKEYGNIITSLYEPDPILNNKKDNNQ